MADVAINGDELRRGIRDAMERLLQGKPIRSDGKLTIKSLAAEAGIKRWILTHKHTDLQQEFRDRSIRQGEAPDNQKELLAKLVSMKQQLEKYKERVSDLSEESNRLIRALQVLTLENLKLREKLDSKPSKVSHLR